MIFLDVDKNHENNAEVLQRMMDDNKNIFILIHMLGCGPCKQTLPEWQKLNSCSGLKHLQNNNDIVVANVEQSICQKLHNEHLNGIHAFPTIRHIHHNKAQDYEQDRSTDALSKWISSLANLDVDKIKMKDNKMHQNHGNLDMLFANAKTKRKEKKRRKNKTNKLTNLDKNKKIKIMKNVLKMKMKMKMMNLKKPKTKKLSKKILKQGLKKKQQSSKKSLKKQSSTKRRNSLRKKKRKRNKLNPKTMKRRSFTKSLPA